MLSLFWAMIMNNTVPQGKQNLPPTEQTSYCSTFRLSWDYGMNLISLPWSASLMQIYNLAFISSTMNTASLNRLWCWNNSSSCKKHAPSSMWQGKLCGGWYRIYVVLHAGFASIGFWCTPPGSLSTTSDNQETVPLSGLHRYSLIFILLLSPCI